MDRQGMIGKIVGVLQDGQRIDRYVHIDEDGEPYLSDRSGGVCIPQAAYSDPLSAEECEEWAAALLDEAIEGARTGRRAVEADD